MSIQKFITILVMMMLVHVKILFLYVTMMLVKMMVHILLKMMIHITKKFPLLNDINLLLYEEPIDFYLSISHLEKRDTKI